MMENFRKKLKNMFQPTRIKCCKTLKLLKEFFLFLVCVKDFETKALKCPIRNNWMKYGIF